jgi:hypothetical protein
MAYGEGAGAEAVVADGANLKSLSRSAGPQQEASIWIETYQDVLDWWVPLFDWKTSEGLKKILEVSFENSFRQIAGITMAFVPENADALPKGTLLVPILIEGYDIGAKVFSHLLKKGIADDFALVSYSSGIHHEDRNGNEKPEKCFRDGTSMTGFVWATEKHLAKIMDADAILLCDIAFETGITFDVIAESLRAIGYKGKIYQSALFNHSNSRWWNGSVRLWSDTVELTQEHERVAHISRVVPVLTEKTSKLAMQSEPKRTIKA